VLVAALEENLEMSIQHLVQKGDSRKALTILKKPSVIFDLWVYVPFVRTLCFDLASF
jgi:hypothetical protein